MILLNALLIESMPVFINLFIQTILGLIYACIACWIAVDNYSLFSMDKKLSTMGMFHPDEFVTVFFIFGPSAGFLGNMGYLCALKFHSTIVVSGSFLFEPLVSQLFGYFLDIDKFPGWMTWVGAFCVFLGIALIQVADARRKKAKL